jgi:hypothetical protein
MITRSLRKTFYYVKLAQSFKNICISENFSYKLPKINALKKNPDLRVQKAGIKLM